MRIRPKKILVTTLLISMLIGTTAYAQNSPAEKIRSVGNFFTAFFDLDNSTNYLRDTFVQNQCRKRDLFALHAQKDALADTLIDDFADLNSDQIDNIKEQYAILTGELTYVRNIGEKDEEELRTLVISKIRPRISNYREEIISKVSTWHEKYDERAKEYIECRNSWQEVKDQVKSIKQNTKEIGGSWQEFKKQFNKTGEELLRTPSATYENTRDAIVDGAIESFEETVGNFDREAGELIDLVSRDEVDIAATYQEVVYEELSKIEQQQSLAEILEKERQLTVIPEILRKQQDQFEVSQEAALDYAEARIEQSHSDNAAYILWNDILQLNYNIQTGNELMSNDQDGIIELAEGVGNRQCSL